VTAMASSEQVSAAFYDRLGAAGLAGRTTPAWDHQILCRLREMLTPGQRVLDVGCGYGRIAMPLAQSGFDVTGLDVSEVLLQSARERAARQGVAVPWVRASMGRMPLPDTSFDVVLCLWSAFHELLLEEEQLQAVREMRRVLRPGGWCLVEGPLYTPATAEEIRSGQRHSPGNRVASDVVAGLANPHFCHDAESFAGLMERAGALSFEVNVADWAGRPRQFLRFR